MLACLLGIKGEFKDCKYVNLATDPLIQIWSKEILDLMDQALEAGSKAAGDY